jgi:hypothetical protein
MSGPRVVAHLVHGTWPAGGYLAHRYPRLFTRQPVWIDDGSDFRHELETLVPGIEWRPFTWSGENSEIDRRQAARAFAGVLRRELDSARDACHVVIAHSHGGNVALWGLGELDEARRDRVAGLATMGTPFLHFAPRRLSALESSYLRLILAGQLMFLVALVTLPLAIAQLAFEKRLTWDVLLMATLSVCALVPLYFAWRKQRLRAAELERLKPVWPERLASFVALRSRADEASRVIAVGDAAGRALASAWPLVRFLAWSMPWDDRAWRRKVRRAFLLAVVALTAAMLTFAALGPASEIHSLPGWQYWLILLVGAPLFFAVMLCVMLLSVAVMPFTIAMAIVAYSQVFLGLAFGADTFSLAIATEIAAEPNPPRPPPVLEHVDPGDGGMRHSLHAMPAARSRLAAWIGERQAAARLASA